VVPERLGDGIRRIGESQDSSERQRRGRGGVSAAARFPIRLAMGKINTRTWEILWGLGKS
jgi:hypothetical protein